MFKTYASKEWFDPNNGSRRESRFITYKSVKYITTNSDHSWDPLPLLASPGSGSRIIPSHRVAHSSFNTFFFFSALSFFLRHFFHHSSHRIFFQTSSHEKLVTTHSVNSREYFLIYQNVRPIGLAFESKWINFFPDVMNSFPASKSNIFFFDIFSHFLDIFFYFLFTLPSPFKPSLPGPSNTWFEPWKRKSDVSYLAHKHDIYTNSCIENLLY